MKDLINLTDGLTIGGGVGGLVAHVSLESTLSTILTILSILSVIITIILRLIDRIRDAKSDGVVTDDEKRDIIDDTMDDVKSGIGTIIDKKGDNDNGK